MAKTMIDSVVSAMVLVVAAMFAWFAYTTANVQAVRGYSLTARFYTVAGLANGADVKVSGIKVGTVTALDLLPDTFEARVTLAMDPTIRLPQDSVARIVSEGLLGGTYLEIEPGADKTAIPSGGEIKDTQSPEDLIRVIGKKIFGGAGDP